MIVSKAKFHKSKFKWNVPHCHNYYTEHMPINCYAVLMK